MSWFQTTADGVVLNIRVVPRASKTEVQGVLGDALKIRLQAPPVDGKANAALVKFLADKLGIAKSNVTLLSGETGRVKRVLIQSLDEDGISRLWPQ
ncbi:MAG: DUF167 family protein [Verrucomicrobiia bacterium]